MTTTTRASALVLGVSLAVAAGAQAQTHNRRDRSAGDAVMTLRTDMRKLWEDHVTWTRVYIISAAADLPDKSAAATRLLRNQTDIGNAIKPYYGDAAGDQLTGLLRGHILIAADLITAAKAQNDADVKTASTRWNANADSIADFLSTANPTNWPNQTMRNEMRHHLELTLNEATARLHSDWDADIRAYDQVHEHILRLADMLSDGIVHQYPTKVASR